MAVKSKYAGAPNLGDLGVGDRLGPEGAPVEALAPMMDRRSFIATSAAAALPSGAQAAGPSADLRIFLGEDAGPFPHYWETCAGSDRAAVGLRAQWQEDLARVHRAAGIRSVRFHGLFDDEMGVCLSVTDAGPVTNFLYVDQVFDRMLEIGVRPFIELSFMPTALASGRTSIFWYRGNTSPPARMRDWGALVRALGAHLVDRYGIAEVAQWRFECWNEPNIDFWSGSQAQYFELYRTAAFALKQVDARLQVGGPATAQMAWIPEFIEFCRQTGTPVDFVSSHIYPDDPQERVFGRPASYPYEEVMPRALARGKGQIEASARPDLPLVVSEWTSQNPAFIAQMIRDCAGLADTMSYWTFSNVFEERGPIPGFENDVYGLIGQGGVPRPSFHTFALLHQLGERRLKTGEGPVLATRTADGAVSVLAWNLVPRGRIDTRVGDPLAASGQPGLTDGGPRTLTLQFDGRLSGRPARVTRIDPNDDAAARLYAGMGKPNSPSPRQLAALRDAGRTPAAQRQPIVAGRLSLVVPPNAVVLVQARAT